MRMIKKYLLASLLPPLLSLSFTLLHAQASPAASGGVHLVGGGFLSSFSPDYGPGPLIGLGGFADFNLQGHLGAEAEVRFLRFNQTYDVHEDNYSLGPTYRWRFHRWQPYAKFLVGNGEFNFPFSFGHGGYLLIAPGGGLDIPYHRFTIRAVDYEYQHWFKFQNGSLGPNGFSSGIAYRIF
jgi:Outer membrane protein beta-barrel domain